MKRLFWFIVLTVFVLDRFTKALIQTYVEQGASMKLLSFFSIVHFRNTGTLFGLFQNANWFFIVFTFLVAAYIIWKYTAFPSHVQLLLAFILGGALGNLFDRLVYGSVIDFIYFHFWPAFNIADMAISVSVVILVVYELLPVRKI